MSQIDKFLEIEESNIKTKFNEQGEYLVPEITAE
jgi:hypothetical protein